MPTSTVPTYTVSQRFFFDAAHTLRREVDAQSSARIHGHTYQAEVSFRGQPDAVTGMVVDLGLVRAHLVQVREQLDHRFLDEIPALGTPTLENLCRYIVDQFAHFPAVAITCVRVWREGVGDACTLTL